MSDLREYLELFTEGTRNDLAAGTLLPAADVRLPTATVPSPATLAPAQVTEAQKLALDAKQWELDAQWFRDATYVDSRICVRNDFAQPVEVRTMDRLLNEKLQCIGSLGRDLGLSCPDQSFWQLACTKESVALYVFQYARYRWAQERMRELLEKQPRRSADNAGEIIGWIDEACALLNVSDAATNVRWNITGDETWMLRTGLVAGPLPFPAYPPDWNTWARDPGVAVQRPPKFAPVQYGRGKFNTTQWGPHPKDPGLPARLGLAQSKYTFPQILVGKRRSDFLPLWQTQDYPKTWGRPSKLAWDWVRQTVGGGHWLRGTYENTGKRVFIEGVDRVLDILGFNLDHATKVPYFKWVHQALIVAAQGVEATAAQGGFRDARNALIKAEQLRDAARSLASSGADLAKVNPFANPSVTLVMGLMQLIASVVPVAGIVMAAWNTLLQWVFDAAGVQGQVPCYIQPPFLRYVSPPCAMPSEAELRKMFPEPAWMAFSQVPRDVRLRFNLRPVLPGAPGTDAGPPIVTPDDTSTTPKKSSGGVLPVAAGAAALLWFRRR